MYGEQLRTKISRTVGNYAETNVQSGAGELIEFDGTDDGNEGINNGRTENKTQKSVQIVVCVGESGAEKRRRRKPKGSGKKKVTNTGAPEGKEKGTNYDESEGLGLAKAWVILSQHSIKKEDRIWPAIAEIY